MTKIPQNLKITKIPLKPKNGPKYPRNSKNDQNTPRNLKNDQNTLETQKMTKISPKPKNDQNTPVPKKITKIPLKPKNLPKYSSPTTKKFYILPLFY